MEIYRLNTDTYIEEDVIENYESMIWTERFIDPGEFQLVTSDVQNTMSALPLDSYISLRDSKEVMIVETHKIEEDEDTGVNKLTVTGRTFETILEDRVRAQAMNNTDAATYKQGYDPAITPAVGFISDAIETGVLDSHDALPLIIESADYPGQIGSTTWYSIPPQEAYKAIMDIALAQNFGIETLRPPSVVVAPTKLWVHLHRGVDRTVNQTVVEPVVFDVSAGHFETGTYLFSTKDYKNVAYVFSPLGAAAAYAPGVSSAISGINRKILFVDASDLDDVSKLPAGASVVNTLKQRGLQELAKLTKISMFEGKLSTNIPYKYMLHLNDTTGHYRLGDKVTVRAKYGIIQNMVVSEYIRTDGIEGEAAYPTLTIIT